MGSFKDKCSFVYFTRSGLLDLPVYDNVILRFYDNLCNNLNLTIIYMVFGVRKHFVEKPCKNEIFYFYINLIISISWARPKF